MTWVRLAALLGFLSVALGAFGAHALRGKVSESSLSAWQTAVLYQSIHALALLVIALYARVAPGSVEIKLPAVLFTVGILLFSGSLYAMVLSGQTKLGIVTPFGGLSFLAGWVAVFVILGRAPV